MVFVNSTNVLDFRHRVAGSSDALLSESVLSEPRFSLAAALDLALFSLREGGKSNHLAGLNSPHISVAKKLLLSRQPYRSIAPFRHHSFEVFPIRKFQDLQSNEWVLFRARFAESASGGKKGDVFHGVSSVLAEMADNIVWHGGTSRDEPCRGLAAYHVSSRSATFSVADDGRGFLASLQTNPRWKDLASEQEALRAVLLRHATSRVDEKTGGGFTVLYNKLISFNGMVLLRSGDCRAVIKNTSSPTNTLILRVGSHGAGAQVTVIIGKKGDPTEEPLEDVRNSS